MSSLLSWLTWGSTGPITNLGYHDFFGSGFVYVFAGAMAFVLARKVGARPGMYRPDPRVGDFRSYNLGITDTGVILIMAGLPMVILSCGFFFEPEALFVSVNMADTSVGVAFNNLGLAWAGGALSGALIAYRTKNYIYTLLGPFAGYVSGAPGFDVYSPWEMLLVAFSRPWSPTSCTSGRSARRSTSTSSSTCSSASGPTASSWSASSSGARRRAATSAWRRATTPSSTPR